MSPDQIHLYTTRGQTGSSLSREAASGARQHGLSEGDHPSACTIRPLTCPDGIGDDADNTRCQTRDKYLYVFKGVRLRLAPAQTEPCRSCGGGHVKCQRTNAREPSERITHWLHADSRAGRAASGTSAEPRPLALER